MKKKIINGILLVAMLFATTSAFVSCKDTDADYKSEMDAKYASLEKKLADLQALVSSIKSCNCDMTSINARLAALEAAVQTIPSLDGYVKTTDLPDAVKALLGDYYTKAEVDALINGINIPEGLTEAKVKELIEGALKDYAKKSDIPEQTPAGLDEATVKKLIEDALKDYAKKSDIPEQTPAGLDEDAVKKLIADALKDYTKTADLPTVFTKEEIINIIKETIETTETDLTIIYKTEVTSLSVEQISNPLFTFLTPFGVQPNVLLAYFGEKARRDLYFPKGSEEPIVYKGEYILGGNGNAGKLYVTVNPSSVDFSGKTLKLMTTGGDEGPVELTPLEASNENLMYLTRGDNAFYETYATISQDKLAKAYVSWEPQDMEAFKDEIKDLLKGRSKTETLEMVRTIYNLVVDNDVPVYRLQAAWGENSFTYSPANIAAIAMKPLSYSFDLSDEAEYDGEAITALEKFEGKVVVWGTKSESAQNKIWRFLNKFNIGAEKLLNNINWALQPTLLISTDTEVSHPEVYSIENAFTRYDAGEVKLLPTSWSAEVLAPAFKKFVAITSVDGTPVSADDPVNAGLLGKVIPGSVKEIPFTIEPGKTYNIQYSAMDYDGNIRTLNYVIKGNKVYE